MNVRRHFLPLLMAFALVACTAEEDGQTTSTSTPVTSEGTGAARAACTDVVGAAGTLATELGRFVAGDASADQVRASAEDLAAAVDAAQESVGPDVQTLLDDAGLALQRVWTALEADPVDVAEMRGAAGDLATALGDVVTICGSSPTTST
jgi:hypothetical protein